MICVVNVTEDWGIGYENQLLVSIPADLKRFFQLTKEKTVILGRKTLETFPGGRPLPKRRNLILSSDPNYRVEGAEVFQSIPALLAACGEEEDLCVIGGASVYEAFLPYCKTAYVTRTLGTYRADRYFRNLDQMANWELLCEGPVQEENGIRFQYMDYVNHSPLALSGAACAE